MRPSIAEEGRRILYTVGMPALRAFFDAMIDALFPLAPAERALMMLGPEEAYCTLPRAPAYDGSVASLPGTESIFAYKDERVACLVNIVKNKKSSHGVRLGGHAMWRELLSMGKEGGNEVSGPVSAPAGAAPVSRRLRASEDSLDPIPALFSGLLIPIPITPRRRRERGYNQCELLADEIVRLDGGVRFAVEKQLLVRVQHSSQQKLKGRKDRISGATGIFAVNESSIPRDTPLIVIDDVITTGSTMKEAIDTLRAAGFSDVRGLSLAH